MARRRRWPLAVLAVVVLVGGIAVWSYRPRPVPPPVPGNGPVRAADAPWVVALADRPDGGGPPVKQCAGTLVAPRAVVTAGHCVARREPSAMVVLVGRADLRTGAGTEVGVADLWTPPDGVPAGGDGVLTGLVRPRTSPPDIGLVLLDSPAGATPLPMAGTGPPASSPARYLGWRVSPQDEPVLWQSPEVVLDDAVCTAAARDARSVVPPVAHGWSYDPADYLCTAGTAAPGPGTPMAPHRPTDSGAPVVVGGRLAGVNAWGPDPDPAVPNFHARVATYAAGLTRLLDAAGRTGRFP
ncbi:S1 family peptidase [Pseudonocardia sp. HH130629-09]|uniref:S1 family peptidase n=1 Tax=Pseudonocardia sp. HH130629-09 TaxID=1641402 RepID=UPI0007620617|nr:trypsin-like serine protease [Pseudonocardia sp. HH130629-09]